MEEEKIPTMSPFCEAIMDATEVISSQKTPSDSALILCSDGNTMACRVAGGSLQVSEMLKTKMQQDPVFAETVARAVFEYITQTAYQNSPTFLFKSELRNIGL